MFLNNMRNGTKLRQTELVLAVGHVKPGGWCSAGRRRRLGRLQVVSIRPRLQQLRGEINIKNRLINRGLSNTDLGQWTNETHY